MLHFSPWKIEQHAFEPAQEAAIERQLAFSNGYISQYASFEEHYSGEQSLGTWLRGINSPLPPFETVSVHLHDETLDLNKWQILSFYRRLNRQQPLLERAMTLKAPTGHTLEISANRLLDTSEAGRMSIVYRVHFVDYDGPASFLSLLGEPKPMSDWYPLAKEIKGSDIHILLQHRREDIQVSVASSFTLLKNDEPVSAPLIRIDKRYIWGLSVTDRVKSGDTVELRKDVLFSDSVNNPDQLSY